jgi:hypothetical protein
MFVVQRASHIRKVSRNFRQGQSQISGAERFDQARERR